MQNPARIIPFVKRGGLVQITGGSILGAFGDSSRETGVFFLKNGFVHFIASDAHSLSFRPPEILKAVTIAGHIIGKVAALALARENPQSVIDGRRFPANPDVRPEGFNARW
ncbi:MAG: hypothetical protein HY883_04560 [Deltaproteobacteria bacterium]|nr:hypothetical protein [Deltaproteobacteria bacterium]